MTHTQSYPVTDTAAFQDTDDADAVTVLAAVRHCANSWEGDARLLGNVRARDIARACTLAIDALSQPVSLAQGAPDLQHAITECQAWREAVVQLRDMAIEHGSRVIEDRCFDILMTRPLYPLPSTDRVNLPGHDETMANLDALTISSKPRCTCAAMVNPNIPHARFCPLSSTEGK